MGRFGSDKPDTRFEMEFLIALNDVVVIVASQYLHRQLKLEMKLKHYVLKEQRTFFS